MNDIEIFDGVRLSRKTALNLFLILGVMVVTFFVYLAKTEGLIQPPSPPQKTEQPLNDGRNQSL